MLTNNDARSHHGLGAYVQKDEDTECYIVRCPSLNVVTAVRNKEDAIAAITSAANLITRHRFRRAIEIDSAKSTGRTGQFDVTVPLEAVSV